MKNILFLILLLLCQFLVVSQEIWNRIPEFPTNCYSDDDNFIDSLNNELKLVEQELRAQLEINDPYFDSLPALKPTLLTNKNISSTPISEEELIEQIYDRIHKDKQVLELGEALMTELQSLHSDYITAIYSLNLLMIEFRNFHYPPSPGTPEHPRYIELSHQYNTEYEKLCAKYYQGENAIFILWLKKYKKYLTESQIALFEKYDSELIETYGFTEYVSIAPLQAISDYMSQCMSIFAWRRYTPLKK